MSLSFHVRPHAIHFAKGTDSWQLKHTTKVHLVKAMVFPVVMYGCESWTLKEAAAAAKSLQSCPTLCDPTRFSSPWDSPGKNTGVSCHFVLQRMKVKSESEVIQSCPNLSDPMDCSLPGSSVHGIFQARILEWGAIAEHRTTDAFEL